MTGAPSFSYDPEDESTQRDPYPLYRRLRDELPVYRQPRLGFYAYSRHADVMEALRDHTTYCSSGGLTWDTTAAEQAGVLGMLVTTDPPQHTKLRKLVNHVFTPHRVASLERDIHAVASDRFRALRDRGGGDLVDDIAVPLPTSVIGRFLGVPEADRDRFHVWATAIVSGTSGAAFHDAHHRAARELYAYFRDRIAHRLREPADDLLGTLLSSTVDDERLRHEDVLGFCFNLIVGGIETTTNLLTAGMVLLQAHPGVRARLTADPATLPDAIEEMLRLETPVQGLCRTTTREVTRHEVTIPAGAKVLLLFGSANRDERAFADPEVFRLGRGTAQHLAFGYGAHYCIGAAVARLMGRVAFAEALQTFGAHRIEIERGVRVRSAVNRGWARLPVRLLG